MLILSKASPLICRSLKLKYDLFQHTWTRGLLLTIFLQDDATSQQIGDIPPQPVSVPAGREARA